MPPTPGRGRLPSGWRQAGSGRLREALIEVVVLVLVLLVFTRVHDAVGTDVVVATDNARVLQSVERALHLDVEVAMNRWLAGHGAMITPAVGLYRLYYVVLVAVLLWVFVRHGNVYRHVRRALVAMAGLALLVYWALPMSPPRFAQSGIVDIIAEHDLWGGTGLREANNYSAMPSLHVGWSALAAYATWCALRTAHPRAALSAWVFPAVMVADVLATGAHYVLDVAGGAALLGTSIAAALVWGRLVERPAHALTLSEAGPRKSRPDSRPETPPD